jgi:colicin import membrane protein
VPVPEPEVEKLARADPAPVPATEVLPEPKPKAEMAPEPDPAPAVADNPDAEQVKLPETAPIPQARPQPPEAQTAKAPERKDSDRPARETARAPEPEESDFKADEVAALIDRAKASGGGAERSEREAALGNRQDSAAKQLSQGELDALRSQLESCWSPPIGTVGSSEFTASVKFQVDLSRQLAGQPTIIRSSGNRQFDDSVLRAVHICNDRGFELPEGKQAVWADIIVNFDPSGMF